jgi:hypothetical protein
MRRIGAPVGALALALLAGLAGPAAGGTSAGCAPVGARTLAASGSARLYVAQGTLYGCLGARRTRLGAAPGQRRLAATRIGLYALSPRYAGFDTVQMGVDNLDASVSIVDLATAATVAGAPATTPEDRAESFIGVRALAIDRGGTLAWIGSRSGVGAFTPIYEVHTLDVAGRDRLVASGADIAPDSLSLHGTKLRWRQGGRLRSSAI